MVDGLVNGILAAPGKVLSAIKSIIMGPVNWVQQKLDINSPSRLFRYYGSSFSEGMALGIDKKRQLAFASARRLATGVAGAAALGGAALSGTAATAATPAAAPVNFNVTINLKQLPGEDAAEFAKRVKQEFERLFREYLAGKRSEFGD